MAPERDAGSASMAGMANVSRCVPGFNLILAGSLPIAAGNSAELFSALHSHQWRHIDA
jgi:hypothetical protein